MVIKAESNYMSIYEVWVIVWSSEEERQITRLAGTFDNFMNARLFKEAYNNRYCANAEIVEYAKVIK